MIPTMAAMTILSLSCTSDEKQPAGIVNGRLSPCPTSPNCASSEEPIDQSGHVEPFKITGAAQVALVSLRQAIQSVGGSIQQEDPDYIWATFRTKLFGFVDDVEFRMDETNQLIHVRSASRVGYSDLGVNRRRVEALRRSFEQELSVRGNKSPGDDFK